MKLKKKKKPICLHWRPKRWENEWGLFTKQIVTDPRENRAGLSEEESGDPGVNHVGIDIRSPRTQVRVGVTVLHTFCVRFGV